jgi:hypothetical protein
VNNLENFWLNYTPIEIIVNHTGILDYDYKYVVGKGQTLSCKDSQVSHLSSCYNKDEIPKDYGFIAFNPIDWKGTFSRNCTLNQKDTGFTCLNPPSFSQGEIYGWKIGDKPFSLDGARERCEKHHQPSTCHSCLEIVYPDGFHHVDGVCGWCQSDKPFSETKEIVELTPHVPKLSCDDPNYLEEHDSYCYPTGSTNNGWEYDVWNLYRRPQNYNPNQNISISMKLELVGFCIGAKININ